MIYTAIISSRYPKYHPKLTPGSPKITSVFISLNRYFAIFWNLKRGIISDHDHLQTQDIWSHIWSQSDMIWYDLRYFAIFYIWSLQHYQRCVDNEFRDNYGNRCPVNDDTRARAHDLLAGKSSSALPLHSIDRPRRTRSPLFSPHRSDHLHIHSTRSISLSVPRPVLQRYPSARPPLPFRRQSLPSRRKYRVQLGPFFKSTLWYSLDHPQSSSAQQRVVWVWIWSIPRAGPGFPSSLWAVASFRECAQKWLNSLSDSWSIRSTIFAILSQFSQHILNAEMNLLLWIGRRAVEDSSKVGTNAPTLIIESLG